MTATIDAAPPPQPNAATQPGPHSPSANPSQSFPAVPTLPANAPFSPRQRAWLNGFFAGLVTTGRVGNGSAAILPTPSNAAPPPANGSATGPSPGTADAAGSADTSGTAEPTAATSWRDVEDDDPHQYPWHQSELPIDERMELAENQPHDLKLMAAMAQLDCGQCGYLCRTYAKAIETGEESNLKLCAPGGKQTSRMLVKLRKQAPAENPKPDPAGEPPSGPDQAQRPDQAQPLAEVNAPVPLPDSAPALSYIRQNPFPAAAIGVEKLTADGSAKDTRLISLSLSGSGLRYKVGDALGVFPKNSKDQVEALIRLLGHDGCEPVRTPDGVSTTFRGALSEHCDLKLPSDEFLERLLEKASADEDRKNLQRCLDETEVAGLIEQPRVIDVIARFRSIPLTVEDVVQTLDPLKPRLYSIVSSPRVNPNQVDLVVGVVQYRLAGQARRGVASTFLANRMIGHEPVPVFVQSCHHFGLPDDPATPIIMVGPGTGVAPFRAFLHDRRAVAATGDSWLFFGDQHEATDFLLRDELESMRRDGSLTRLDTAFSRDQADRVYVQHRLLEHRETVWQWLERGAHFYVCGDASRMAGDVDRAVHEIVASAGGRSAEAAAEYVNEMKKSGRYQRDVY